MVSRQKVLSKVFGDPQRRIIKNLEKRVKEINELESKYQKMDDKELADQTNILKEKLSNKKTTLDTILPDAFALVRESSRRILGMRHFDVQMIGGMVLHEGNVAEMKTGEGKTITSIAPVYLNSITGSCVIISTVNEYLAQRDAEEMGQVFK